MAMVKKKFEVGQTVYLDDGAVAEYRGEIDGVHYVRHQLKFQNSNEIKYSSIYTVEKLFDEEPVWVYDKEITMLKGNIARLHDLLLQSRKRLDDIHAQIQLFDWVEKYDFLQTAVDLVEGSITHIAILPDAEMPYIEEFPISISPRTNNSKPDNYYRTISLFEPSKQWFVQRCGVWVKCIPAKSLEEAQHTIISLFEAELDAYENAGVNMNHLYEENEYLKFPDSYKFELEKQNRIKLEREIFELEMKINEKKKQL